MMDFYQELGIELQIIVPGVAQSVIESNPPIAVFKINSMAHEVLDAWAIAVRNAMVLRQNMHQPYLAIQDASEQKLFTSLSPYVREKVVWMSEGMEDLQGRVAVVIDSHSLMSLAVNAVDIVMRRFTPGLSTRTFVKHADALRWLQSYRTTVHESTR